MTIMCNDNGWMMVLLQVISYGVAVLKTGKKTNIMNNREDDNDMGCVGAIEEDGDAGGGSGCYVDDDGRNGVDSLQTK